MKNLILIALIMTAGISNAQEKPDITKKIIALEKAALERWNNGDPNGFLELSANDVVYFDPFLEKRIDGLEVYKPAKPYLKAQKESAFLGEI